LPDSATLSPGQARRGLAKTLALALITSGAEAKNLTNDETLTDAGIRRSLPAGLIGAIGVSSNLTEGTSKRQVNDRDYRLISTRHRLRRVGTNKLKVPSGATMSGGT
jgi:hypothetical protein